MQPFDYTGKILEGREGRRRRPPKGADAGNITFKYDGQRNGFFSSHWPASFFAAVLSRYYSLCVFF